MTRAVFEELRAYRSEFRRPPVPEAGVIIKVNCTIPKISNAQQLQVENLKTDPVLTVIFILSSTTHSNAGQAGPHQR
jgi:hypothetical protein